MRCDLGVAGESGDSSDDSSARVALTADDERVLTTPDADADYGRAVGLGRPR